MLRERMADLERDPGQKYLPGPGFRVSKGMGSLTRSIWPVMLLSNCVVQRSPQAFPGTELYPLGGVLGRNPGHLQLAGVSFFCWGRVKMQTALAV